MISNAVTVCMHVGGCQVNVIAVFEKPPSRHVGAFDLGRSPPANADGATWPRRPNAVHEPRGRVLPADKLNALRRGRRLVGEVAAKPGRRAFIDITPSREQNDDVARCDGWDRSSTQRSITIEHWDHDEQQTTGFDYDIGAERIRGTLATDAAQLVDVLRTWDLQPTSFDYPWNTADPGKRHDLRPADRQGA